MTRSRITPRFELEDASMARMEPEPLPVIEPPRGRMGSAALLLSGATVLVTGLAVLSAGNFVADEFARSAGLGWAALAVTGAGFGLIGTGVWRELSGLFALSEVDHIRAGLESGEPRFIAAAAREWLEELPDGAALLPVVQAMNDPDSMLALLRTQVVAGLQQRADAMGRTAAMQVFAATAAVPSPALDALVVGLARHPAGAGNRRVARAAAGAAGHDGAAAAHGDVGGGGGGGGHGDRRGGAGGAVQSAVAASGRGCRGGGGGGAADGGAGSGCGGGLLSLAGGAGVRKEGQGSALDPPGGSGPLDPAT